MKAKELRRIMAALDLTQADLMRMANAEREDDKRLAPSTLSRQANGESRVDPFLALFLRALMRERGITQSGPAPEQRERSRAADRRRRTIDALRQAKLLKQ